MYKKLPFRKFILIFALMVSFFAVNAQNTSDTITSQYPMPTSLSAMPGFYAFHLSASLYTAEEINHEAGEIQSLSYSIAPSNGFDYDYSSAKIYLLETTENALDLSQTWNEITANATLVYDGTLSDITPFDYYWHEFVFTQPFTYYGGNIIVLVEGSMEFDNYGGTDYEIGLYCNEGNEDNCWIVMQDDEMFSFDEAMSNLGGSYHDNYENRPDILFTFVSSHENCELTLPYIENFQNYEAYGPMPTCWTRISDEYNEYGDYYNPCVSPGSMADNYDQTLFFMLMDTDDEYAILPKVPENVSVSDLTLKFKFKSAQQYSTAMVIGVMSNPDNASTFVPVDTIRREGAAFDYEDKEINFSTYSGNGRYIAFFFSRSVSSSMYPSCFIDDVEVSASDFCTPPVQISSTVNGTEATITWNYTNNAQGVRIYYKAESDDEYDFVELYDDNFNTFYNLPSGVLYNYYLVSICGEDEESAPSAVYSFVTECDAISEFPWFDGFENGINCWSIGGSLTGQSWDLTTIGEHFDFNSSVYYPYAGNYMMQFDAYHFTENNYGTLTTPKMDMNQNLNLSFKYHTFGDQEVFDWDGYYEYPNDDEMWWKPAAEKIEVYVNNQPTLTDANLLATFEGYSTTAAWETANVSIPSQQDFGYIIFKAYFEGGYNMAIDDVSLTAGATEYEYVTIDTAICNGESVTLNGTDFSTEGTHVVTYNDSVVTLNLTVNPTYNIVINDTIAEGETYTDNGFNVDSEGTFYQNLQTINGCDSIITLNLSVIQVEPNIVYVTIDTAICNGESVTLNGTDFSTEGTHVVTYNDSVVTLNLTVNPTYNIVINDSIAEGETYTDNGFNVSEAGTYTLNLETVNGCDSTITLNLTTTVGVENFDNIGINVAPNPATDYFTVNVKNINSNILVELIDMGGRVLRSKTMIAGETSARFNRDNLPNGIYMLRLTYDNNRQTRKVILK